MSKHRDPRVWREGVRATVVNDVVAIQNLDRHLDTPKRRAYLKAHRERYTAEAPGRRAMNPTVVCQGCWEKKATDGSDGGGGFTPDNNRRTGWKAMCRPCRAKARRERQKAEQV